ncbi:MAG: 30S ribosomal protein S8 [Patescibacteria group bacterium]|nr:30S ribosomal protein S8 [Patescibacteria group bacterium]
MDPISNMLIKIRNAQAVRHQTVQFPYSGLKMKLAEILLKEGFLSKVEKERKKPSRWIKVGLKYLEENRPAISGLKKISKPGQRLYKKAKEIKKVKGGYGIAVISTSKGLMTDKEARKKKLGGEVICEIW